MMYAFKVNVGRCDDMDSEKPAPICDYEGSDYQDSFWDRGGREYEDRTEAIALRRLLPESGGLLLEVGAGAGRNTPRYGGFTRVVLLDYSLTQLEKARSRLGGGDRHVYVAADVYRLPFVEGLFDCATMIRTLHHMVDAPGALEQVRIVLQPGGVFILEFANKLNLKAILRYGLGRQEWSPFTLDPVEFVKLNFNFHPAGVRRWLADLGFSVERTLTVSHFRLELLKKTMPLNLLVGLDALLQWTGSFWQLTPSVFMRARLGKGSPARIPENPVDWFKCPVCSCSPLEAHPDYLACPDCDRKWPVREGIYDFREALTG
jgi:ubiquinone/menaquinone biosynthesis C-methylase UbiE